MVQSLVAGGREADVLEISRRVLVEPNPALGRFERVEADRLCNERKPGVPGVGGGDGPLFSVADLVTSCSRGFCRGGSSFEGR